MAMEGPTPVSALIHAATMVTAGVYLLMRSSPLIEYSNIVLLLCLWLGGITTVFSSVIGLFQQDIKKIVAYSTMSHVVVSVAVTIRYISLNLLLQNTRNLISTLDGYVDVAGKMLANFFKEAEYSYCYTPSPLICNNDNDEDDTKNSYLIKFKFNEFNPESMGRISIDNLLYKKSQLPLPLQDYNTFILEIVDNITTGGI